MYFLTKLVKIFGAPCIAIRVTSAVFINSTLSQGFLSLSSAHHAPAPFALWVLLRRASLDLQDELCARSDDAEKWLSGTAPFISNKWKIFQL